MKERPKIDLGMTGYDELFMNDIVIWGVRKAVHHLHHFVHQWEYIGCHGFAEFCHAGLKKPLYIADYCRPMPSFAIPRHDFPTPM